VVVTGDFDVPNIAKNVVYLQATVIIQSRKRKCGFHMILRMMYTTLRSTGFLDFGVTFTLTHIVRCLVSVLPKREC
jgi:hypothetical protein